VSIWSRICLPKTSERFCTNGIGRLVLVGKKCKLCLESYLRAIRCMLGVTMMS
jgi:hypothetical protein